MKRKESYCGSEASFDNLMADQARLASVSSDSQFASGENLEPSVKEIQQIKPESDRDSDYEGSDVESRGEVTTLKMLFEKCRSSDQDFFESCTDVGLLNPDNDKCSECDIPCPYIEIPTSLDNLVRRCCKCGVEWSVRRDSWVDGMEGSLKEIALTVYCWCRGYSHALASHELEIDPNVVVQIFSKCSSVAPTFYQNPLSNIGGKNKNVLTDVFQYNDRLIIGLNDQHSKNVYYEILRENYDVSAIITILIDNLTEGSMILTNDDSRLCRLLDEECLAYLKESWDINFKTDSVSTEPLIVQWTEFESQLPPVHNLDPTFAHLSPDSILKQSLFRKRMENSKDCFLFFLAVVAHLFNSCS